jgi:hypothetical protein
VDPRVSTVWQKEKEKGLAGSKTNRVFSDLGPLGPTRPIFYSSLFFFLLRQTTWPHLLVSTGSNVTRLRSGADLCLCVRVCSQACVSSLRAKCSLKCPSGRATPRTRRRGVGEATSRRRRRPTAAVAWLRRPSGQRPGLGALASTHDTRRAKARPLADVRVVPAGVTMARPWWAGGNTALLCKAAEANGGQQGGKMTRLDCHGTHPCMACAWRGHGDGGRHWRL